MEVSLTRPGRYVVAVSGGVDSMSLLHALHADSRYELIVAHLDHGIRDDSAADRRLVEQVAQDLGLPFFYEEATLGAHASEAAARQVRYGFLERVRGGQGALAIVTAHHQDDALETAVINMLRGTGRKGLTSLAGRDRVERPLLGISKRDIRAYAQANGLTWREDSTNSDTDYLRNYVRHRLLARFGDQDRARLATIVVQARGTNGELDDILDAELAHHVDAAGLDRHWFVQLPHAVARETMAAWLREDGLRDFDRKTLERLVVAAKTAHPGKVFDVRRGVVLNVGRKDLALAHAER
jgi:tRNA(Ile)-lysidine synthase